MGGSEGWGEGEVRGEVGGCGGRRGEGVGGDGCGGWEVRGGVGGR